jgi:hypothetical protein
MEKTIQSWPPSLRFLCLIAVGTVITDRPPQASRIVARTGLRMMPTFPRSPLSFRTAGFPQYGWKVCVSDGTFLGASRLSSLPAYARSSSSLSPSFVSADQPLTSSTESGNGGPTDTAKSGRDSPHPRGPRSGLGYSVPIHHHLIDPIRPTRRHVRISPQCDLYRAPSLCGSASATHEWFRTFACCSVRTCRSL